MSNETIVRVTADASGYTAGMEKAQRSAEQFLASQDAAAARTKAAQDAITEAMTNGSQASTRQINNFINSLEKQASAAGKSRAEILAMQAANMGVTASTQAYIDKIASASAHTEEMSLKTAGARRELLVLAHEASQGNWTRFGGSMMVLGERMDAMSLILNPVALGFVAVAGAAYLVYSAFESASKQSEKFNESLKLTSNWANLTNDSAAILAQTISQDMGTSFNTARSAVDATAASGRVLGVDIQTVTEIAMLMAKATGDSFDKALESVVKQADGVSAAAMQWQQSHHDMDAATLDHIKTLDAAGDHSTALRLLYGQELATMSDDTKKEIGVMHGLWNGFLDYMGQLQRDLAGTTNIQDQRAALVSQMTNLDMNPDRRNDAFYEKQIAEIDAQIAAQKKNTDAVNQVKAAKDSLSQLDEYANNLIKQGQTNEEKRTIAIKAANNAYKERIDLAKQAGSYTPQLDSQYAAQRDRIASDAERMYKDPKVAKPKAYQDDAATRFIQQIRDQDAATKAALDSNDKLTGAEKMQAEFAQKIADIKSKDILTADQKSLLANQDKIKATIDQYAADEKSLKLKGDSIKLDERSAQVNAQIANYQQSQQAQYARQLNAIGMGSEAQKNAQAVKSIYAEYARQQEQITKSSNGGTISSQQYADESDKIQAGLAQSLQDYDTYYAELKKKQADWTFGSSTAMANYVDATHNMMAQAGKVVGDVFKGMEDALVNFTMTGKLNFASFANSIISEIIRIQARQAISSAIGGAGSSGWLTTLAGAAINYFGGTSATASTASAMPGDSLDNFLNLNNNFSTAPVASAAGGFDIPSGTNPVTQLHQNEMVLPSQYADVIRGLASNNSSSSSAPVAVSVNVDASGSSVSSDAAQSKQLGQVIAAAIQATLIKEKRPGGILA